LQKVRLFHYFIISGSQDINAYCQTRNDLKGRRGETPYREPEHRIKAL